MYDKKYVSFKYENIECTIVINFGGWYITQNSIPVSPLEAGLGNDNYHGNLALLESALEASKGAGYPFAFIEQEINAKKYLKSLEV